MTMTKSEKQAHYDGCKNNLLQLIPQDGHLYFLIAHQEGRKTYYHRVFVVAMGRIVEVTASVAEMVAPVYGFATQGRDKYGITADVDAQDGINQRLSRALYPDAIQHKQSGATVYPLTYERL